MKPVLVNTSVWVDHFRRRNCALVELLEIDAVMTHPLVWGELAFLGEELQPNFTENRWLLHRPRLQALGGPPFVETVNSLLRKP